MLHKAKLLIVSLERDVDFLLGHNYRICRTFDFHMCDESGGSKISMKNQRTAVGSLCKKEACGGQK